MFKLGNQQGCVQEVLDTLNADIISRRSEMIRAIVPACISFQIPVKLGVKLVAQTAALFWSLDHVFCNFEAGTAPPLSPPLSLFQLCCID
jgi:hypothetical protein